MKNPKTLHITQTAMLAAIAGALMSLELSVPLMPVFYKLDLSSVPTIIAVFLYGPISGFTVEIVKMIIKLLTVGTNSMYVGEFANLIALLFFILPLNWIYKKNGKTLSAAIWALVATVLIRTFSATLINLFISLPLYAKTMGVDLDSLATTFGSAIPLITNVKTFIIFATIPFNLLKTGLNSIVAYFIFKRFIFNRQKGGYHG